MELKQFVTETLVQIVQGVRGAQDKVTQGAEINPQPRMPLSGDWITASGQTIRLVDFDVAVTVSEGSGRKGGGGISVFGVGVGAQGESTTASSSVSRIKFQAPIALP